MTKKTSKDWIGKTALITGASSGIGAAAARELASHGIRVILTARRVERLEILAKEICQSGGEAQIIVADLGKSEERRELFRKSLELTGSLDILINNAGLGWYGYAAEMPWETAQNILQVNLEATVELCLLALPAMQAKGKGHIINVGSVVGGIPSQGVAVYAATKAFLDAFTTSVYRELAGSQVRISVIRAGPVRTEFYDTAAENSNGLRIPVERFAVSDRLVARRIFTTLQRPSRYVYVPTWMAVAPAVEATFGWFMDRLGPLLLKAAHQPKGS